MIVCHVCGTENPDGAKFCEGCGVELSPAAPVSTPMSAPASSAPTMPAVEATPALTGNAPVEMPPVVVHLAQGQREIFSRTSQTQIGRHECWNLHLLPNGFVARLSV